jgi:F-type H+-transporting ATPase subunit epsilon
MADTMQFDLVSPERRLMSLEVRQVQIPGMEGDLTALPDHAPFLTTLRPGIVRVEAGGDTTEYVVTGGFAEISPEAASVLAEQAVPRDDADAAMLQALADDAESELAVAQDEERRAADQRVRDIAMLRTHLSR